MEGEKKNHRQKIASIKISGNNLGLLRTSKNVSQKQKELN